MMEENKKIERLSALNQAPIIIQCQFRYVSINRRDRWRLFRKPTKLQILSHRMIQFSKAALLVGSIIFILLCGITATIYFNIDPIYLMLGLMMGFVMASLNSKP